MGARMLPSMGPIHVKQSGVIKELHAVWWRIWILYDCSGTLLVHGLSDNVEDAT
jgi:hypothetical protein